LPQTSIVKTQSSSTQDKLAKTEQQAPQLLPLQEQSLRVRLMIIESIQSQSSFPLNPDKANVLSVQLEQSIGHWPPEPELELLELELELLELKPKPELLEPELLELELELELLELLLELRIIFPEVNARDPPGIIGHGPILGQKKKSS